MDLFIGPFEYEYLPEIIKNELSLQNFNTNLHINVFNKTSCFVPIMKGCENFCSYCIVPYVRGKEISRDVNDVLDEIRTLLDNGVKEIVLIGQNVNSYNSYIEGNVEVNFAKLLQKVAVLDTHKK